VANGASIIAGRKYNPCTELRWHVINGDFSGKAAWSGRTLANRSAVYGGFNLQRGCVFRCN
jgi:hypothetical protein